MPAPLMAQSTVAPPGGALPATVRVMVNTAVWPSLRAASSTAMEKDAVRASMVTEAVAVAAGMAAPLLGLLRVTVSVSRPSSTASSVMAKVRVWSPRAVKRNLPSVSAPLSV